MKLDTMIKKIIIILFQITSMNKCYHDVFLMVNLNLNGLKSRLHFLFAKHIFSMFFL